MRVCSLASCTQPVQKLKRCIGCLNVWYCCELHQVSDWNRHKVQCVPSRTQVRRHVRVHELRMQHQIDQADPLVRYIDCTSIIMRALRPLGTTPFAATLLELKNQLFLSSMNNGAKLIYGFTNNYYTRRFFSMFKCKLTHDYVLWLVGTDFSSLRQTHGYTEREHHALCSLFDEFE